MKKVYLFVLLIFSVLLSQGQQDKFIGGVLFDLNGIGLTGDSGQFWNSPEDKEGEGHGGLSLGVFVKREFTKKMYGLFELRYSTKGSNYRYTNQYGSQSYESLYLNYVELPILLGYKFKSGKRHYYLESGFEISKLISSRLESGYREGTPTTEGFKNYDLLWVGSMKAPIVKKWKKYFLMGIRVCSSIIPINSYYKIYNLEYGIEFSYMFN